MPECVDELSSFARIKHQQLFLTHASHMWISIPIGLRIHSIFLLTLTTIYESRVSMAKSPRQPYPVESVKSSVYSSVYEHTAEI